MEKEHVKTLLIGKENEEIFSMAEKRAILAAEANFAIEKLEIASAESKMLLKKIFSKAREFGVDPNRDDDCIYSYDSDKLSEGKIEFFKHSIQPSLLKGLSVGMS